jgi:hypothetical protein
MALPHLRPPTIPPRGTNHHTRHPRARNRLTSARTDAKPRSTPHQPTTHFPPSDSIGAATPKNQRVPLPWKELFMTKPPKYEIVLLGEGAKRRAVERAEAKAAAAAAAVAAKRVKEGRRSKRRWAAGKRAAEEKLRADREALAAAFAGATPAGRRLAQRDREAAAEVVVSSPDLGVGVVSDRGVAAAAVNLASPVEPDGAVPAGFVMVGSELIRIGRDDLADLGRRRADGSPFGRGGG